MEIQTELFQQGINFLCNIQNTQIFKESLSLYTENGCLWGNTIQKDNRLLIRVKLSENINENFKAVLHSKDLKASVEKYEQPSFTLNVDGERIIISARLTTRLVMFSKEATHIKLESVSTGMEMGVVDSPFNEEDLELFKAYLEYITGPLDDHPFVYIKDNAIATDKNILRKTLKDFKLPYLIGLDNTLVKLLQSVGADYTIEFYDDVYIVKSCTDKKSDGIFTIVSTRPDRKHDGIYDEMKKYTNDPIPETNFYFNREKMISALKYIKHFVPSDNQNLKLDLTYNRIYVSSETKDSKAPITFEVKGNFTYKYVAYSKFFPLLSRGEDVVVIRSGEAPYPVSPNDTNPFLRIINSEELIIIAPAKGE